MAKRHEVCTGASWLYLDEAVIASADDDVLHFIMNHAEDFCARMGIPAVQQVGIIVGVQAHIPNTD